jgi:glutamine amidotransferase
MIILIAIIDYGVGNLQSVRNAFAHVGYEAEIVSDPQQLTASDKAVLPGVGAFGAAMEQLEKSGFIPAIQDFIKAGKAFLGICLGLQLLFSQSEEVFGQETTVKGLNLIPGTVRRFPEMGLKVPQIGWNQLRFAQPSPLWKGLEDGCYTYFVNSYYVDPIHSADVLCTSDYGIQFCAGIQRDNVMAVQFHPEKSGRVGLTMLKNFGAIG